MSVVMAVKQGDRIWFGADTQATSGSDRYNYLSPNDYKVIKLDNGVLLTWTGLTVNGQFVLSHPEWFTVDDKKGLTKEHIVTKIIPKIYEAFSEEDLFDKGEDGVPPLTGGTILIAYKDKLFEICRDLQVIAYADYQATGSGANAIVYGLSKVDKTKDINEQLLHLLKISAMQDTHVSGPFVFIDSHHLKYTVKEG